MISTLPSARTNEFLFVVQTSIGSEISDPLNDSRFTIELALGDCGMLLADSCLLVIDVTHCSDLCLDEGEGGPSVSCIGIDNLTFFVLLLFSAELLLLTNEGGRQGAAGRSGGATGAGL